MPFEKEQFISSVQVLPQAHQIAFAASCSERLIPIYKAFQIVEGWGNYPALRRNLDYVWENVGTGKADVGAIEKTLKECEELIPDADDFQNVYLIGAQYSAISILHSTALMNATDAEALYKVSKCCLETTHGFLSDVNDPTLKVHAIDGRFEDWIDSAPLYQWELKKQSEDLALLASVQVLDDLFLREFRESSAAGGISPFARGLLKDKMI